MGLTAEHLRFSHPALAIVLVNLFNSMLKYDIVPDEFANSNTISIPKSDQIFGKALSIDDFTRISISPVFLKLFKHCVIDRFDTLKKNF